MVFGPSRWHVRRPSRSQRLKYAQAGHDQDAEHDHDAEKEYYRTRDFFNGAPVFDVSVAAALVYMNKVGFNGLYRVNGDGEFNVPFGRHRNPLICDEANLRACSAALSGAELHHEDFAKVLGRAQSGDVVYLDPPYQPTTKTAKFTEYTVDGFSFRDQQRLRDVALQLKRRGVHVLMSNSAAPEIVSLYERDFTITVVQAKRRINSKAEGRGAVDELIISSRPR